MKTVFFLGMLASVAVYQVLPDFDVALAAFVGVSGGLAWHRLLNRMMDRLMGPLQKKLPGY